MTNKTDRTGQTPTAHEPGTGKSLADVMTKNPSVVREGEGLEKVAKLMVECDCGAIPVVGDDNRLRGMITDRDIVVRCVAKGKNPLDGKVGEIMSREVYSVRENESIDRVFRIMSDKQVRRVPVVNDKNEVIGIVAQADVALDTGEDRKVGETVERISEPGNRDRAGH